MKNIKFTLFTATAALAAGLLASLLSGCDGSAGDAGVDDGGDGDATRGDAGDARATSCAVPTPKFDLGGVVTTRPRRGYLVVEAESVPCSTLSDGGPYHPTNCSDPVDGFASGVDQAWCRVLTQSPPSARNPAPTYLAPPYLACDTTGRQVLASSSSPTPFGDVAVCSPSGRFLGWTVGP